MEDINKQIKIDSIIYFVGKVVPSFFSFLMILVFVRLLGQEGFGQFALIQSVILAGVTLGSGWLVQSSLRFNYKYDSIENSVIFFDTLKYGANISIVLTIFFTSIFLYFFNHLSLEIIILSALIIILNIYYSLLSSKLTASLEPRLVCLAEIIRVSAVFLIALLVFFTFDQFGFVSLIVGMLVGSFIGLCVLEKGEKIFTFRPKMNSRMLHEALSYGVPIGMWALVAILLNISDRFFIEGFIGLSETGVYSAVYDVVYKSFGLFLMPVLSATHPIIMKLWNENKHQETYYAIVKGVKVQLLISICFIFVLWLGRDFLILLILGKSDQSAAGLILPVGIGAAAWQMCMFLHKPMEIKNRTIQMLLYVFIALFVNILGNYFFIPIYGYIAAAYTTLLGSLVYMACLSFDWLWCNLRRVY